MTLSLGGQAIDFAINCQLDPEGPVAEPDAGSVSQRQLSCECTVTQNTTVTVHGAEAIR